MGEEAFCDKWEEKGMAGKRLRIGCAHGKFDSRCKSKADGQHLGESDGSWCWDKRRYAFCPIRKPCTESSCDVLESDASGCGLPSPWSSAVFLIVIHSYV